MKLALALLLLASPALAGDPAPAQATEQDRMTPQPAGAAPAFNLPAAALRQAVNGVKLTVIENRRLPLVAVTLVIPRAGASADPSGKEGLTGFVAALMKEGTASHPSAVAFSNAQDDIGASISVAAGNDSMTLSLLVLKENLDKGMALMSELVREPLFVQRGPESSKALERLRQESLAGLQMTLGDPAALAERRLDSRVYPDHPYGRAETEASLKSITLQDAASRFTRGVLPTDAVMAASGDLSADELKTLADKHFGQWLPLLTIMPVGPGVPAAAGKPVAAVPAAGGLKIDLIDLPGDQATIRMGHALIPRGHPDYVKVSVMNGILGGPIIGRIEANIREAKSWAYGARSAVEALKQGGALKIETDVQLVDQGGAPVAGPAVRELLAEIRRLQTDLVPADELEAAKNFMNGLYLQRMRTVQQISGRLAANESQGLPSTEIADYPAKVAAVTAQDVQDMAKKYLKPDAIHIVITGPAAAVYPQVSTIAPTRVLTPDGREIQPPAHEPSPAAGK